MEKFITYAVLTIIFFPVILFLDDWFSPKTAKSIKDFTWKMPPPPPPISPSDRICELLKFCQDDELRRIQEELDSEILKKTPIVKIKGEDIGISINHQRGIN